MYKPAKRYYFFQISDEYFFDNVRVKALESDGPQYIVAFQKLVLKAIKTNEPGFLALDSAFDSMPEQISMLLSCSYDFANDFYKACVKRRLFEETKDGILIPLAKELTASRTEKADEMKKRRQLAKNSNSFEDDEEPHFVDVEVREEQSRTKEEKCSTEIEDHKNRREEESNKKETEDQNQRARQDMIQKSTEGAFKKESKPEPQEKIESSEESSGFRGLCQRVINYLNEKVGYRWHPFTKMNKDVIKERLDEGFVEQDFMKVIDIKTEEWKQNAKMYKYLRPITLFGPKMDLYLQQGLNEQVYDPNTTSFRLGNATFNGKGHILGGKEGHKPVPKDYKKPKMAWQC